MSHIAEYKLDDEDNNVWECSECKASWVFNEGSPKENEMRFCPECGRELI